MCVSPLGQFTLPPLLLRPVLQLFSNLILALRKRINLWDPSFLVISPGSDFTVTPPDAAGSR